MPHITISADDSVRRANEAALEASSLLRAERDKIIAHRQRAQAVVRELNTDALEISGRICELERSIFNETLAKLRT